MDRCCCSANSRQTMCESDLAARCDLQILNLVSDRAIERGEPFLRALSCFNGPRVLQRVHHVKRQVFRRNLLIKVIDVPGSQGIPPLLDEFSNGGQVVGIPHALRGLAERRGRRRRLRLP